MENHLNEMTQIVDKLAPMEQNLDENLKAKEENNQARSFTQSGELRKESRRDFAVFVTKQGTLKRNIEVTKGSMDTYCPEQNGVAKSKNRSLTKMTNCMLLESDIERKFWGEAVCTANYLSKDYLQEDMEKHRLNYDTRVNKRDCNENQENEVEIDLFKEKEDNVEVKKETKNLKLKEGWLYGYSDADWTDDSKISEDLTKTVLYEHDQSALKILDKENFKSTKHIETRYHFIKHLKNSLMMKFEYCPSSEMLADILTKPVGATRIQHLREEIGLKE
ncbi:hypothetical protein ILUMI_13304 [Ignelater luminosus]|uniref:Uncharacterized protein n=1 Tax=Ignelater luminosus TaxID=2038154 RepID=A0A8K0D129_IGNLU|nr:hypothetical protein ILUMI_13304 [Ignelater luminosus]